MKSLQIKGFKMLPQRNELDRFEQPQLKKNQSEEKCVIIALSQTTRNVKGVPRQKYLIRCQN